MQSDAVKALVEAARSLHALANEHGWRVPFALDEIIAAVESESAREEAVEHAIARRSLEAVENASKEGSMGDMMSACEGAMHNAITRQFSLLSARNFEVVEIPQGTGCTPCRFFHDGCFCSSPNAPSGRPSEARWDLRPEWCRSRYGVE